jgi:hypothetical protein
MHVTLHVWRAPARKAFPRMAFEPRRVRKIPGVRFAKLLGTGTGTTFGVGDADLSRWAALVVWDGDKPDGDQPDGDKSDGDKSDGDSRRIEAVDEGWADIAESRARIDLTPVSSRGTWSGVEPFGRPAAKKPDGMVLALTRARIRPAKALTFWRAIPPVAATLGQADGLLARFGVGEAPVGFQGTVSVWRSTADLTTFAYRQPEHRAVIARTPKDRWYAEELFARFAVGNIEGDRDVLGWREER